MIEDVVRAIVADACRTAVQPLVDEIRLLRGALDARLPETLVTRAEASRVLGCSLDTVDRQIAAGLLQAERIGRRGVRVRLPNRPEPADLARLAREARTA